MLDLSFSKQYPQFVQGESSSAQVTVSEEQLEEMIKGSMELVKWSAQELRIRELTEAVKDDDANPGRIELGQTYTLTSEFKTGPHSGGIRLTRSEASNKLKTFHFAPNLWQTTFMSS